MPDETTPTLDLRAYLDRVGYTGAVDPTATTLRALHLAHATSVPYENLDIHLGRPIRIDLASIQEKLVRQRRGGYCFEQNTLLAAGLEQIGFTVTRLSARVRYYTTRVLPRIHMVLKVEADGQSWLADVGFGGCGLLEALPFAEDAEVIQHGWKFRLRREPPAYWVLQTFRLGAWQDQYAFTLEPHFPVDYEPANHYCATHPDSRFVQTLTAQRASIHSRHILRNRELTIARPDGEETQTLPDEETLLRLLASRFDLHFPPGTRFRPTMMPPAGWSRFDQG
jgi:N-hydroxyarylamine O-acetyltransferase